MIRSRAYAFHPWRCTSANLSASCAASYESIYVPGDYLGLPYDWGGYMSLFRFDQEIAQGYGAGSYASDGILDCTSGLDCSGFVSRAWGVGHYTTSSIPDISDAISQSQLLAGDVLNQAGYHVVLFSHLLGNGEPALYEAVGPNVHYSLLGGWSWVQGYTPRRYQGITGTTAGDPAGTPVNPIVIGSLPYSDSRDTSQSPSSLLDGCGAAPGTSESGPEYVYQVTFTQPGQLTVSVSDDVGVDIDVHLYTSMNTSDCVARHDSTFTHAVDCGTYYIVADTYAEASNAGPYQLTVTFAPSGATCGQGPPAYDFEGALGAPCAYSGNPNLPFCNENLGSEVCLYSSTSSFCSKACAVDADCTASFAGGCCEDIGGGESYCLTAALCPVGPGPDAGVPGPDSGTPGPDSGSPGPDSGSPGPDSGSPGPDSGSPGPDSGSPGPDSGSPPGPDDPGGCGCASSGSHPKTGLLYFFGALALLLLLARRRRLALETR
jgi:MYXO-CTERM domain-containing protein